MMMLPRFAHGRTETLLEMGAMKRIDAISAFGGIARYSETQQNIIGIRTGARASWLARAEESEGFLFKNVGPGSNNSGRLCDTQREHKYGSIFPNLWNTRQGRTGRYRFVPRRAARCLPAPLLWTPNSCSVPSRSITMCCPR